MSYIVLKRLCFEMLIYICFVFSKSRKQVLGYVVQIEGWDVLYRIEETELVCAISRKLVFG